jgi:hypothetical protein
MPVVTLGPPPVSEIGQDGGALALADADDPVGTGRGQVVSPATMPAVLVGVVGPSVADPFALGERAVQQDEVRAGLA